MCIRDRESAHADDPKRQGPTNSHQQQTNGEHNESLRENGSCLLYTSDAADERSSVDLGGRRIIKKKKHMKSVGRRSMNEIKDRYEERTLYIT